MPELRRSRDRRRLGELRPAERARCQRVMMSPLVMARPPAPSTGQLCRQIFAMEDDELGDRTGKHDVEPSKPGAPIGFSRSDG